MGWNRTSDAAQHLHEFVLEAVILRPVNPDLRCTREIT
jgi:hypothetical protein